MEPRLLAGPALAAGAESLGDHLARLGPLPPLGERRDLPAVLEASGLLGRGGAGFPVGVKWAAVASRSKGSAVVVANGAEGEPLSAKDRTLMAARPHLVIDGAELAADAVGADRIVLYVGAEHTQAVRSLDRALASRDADPRMKPRVPIELITPPARYVAGEESAAVHFVDEGDARPVTTPPRPFERGVGGRPTLVQNVESLAHAALIARRGADWYRAAGSGQTRGSALLTVSGAAHPGVVEVPMGTSIGEVAATAGAPAGTSAVMLGGYFGGWLDMAEAAPLPLDPAVLKASGSAFGCGVVAFLPPNVCGVSATARVLDYMASESAAQCGPCVFGLRSIADAMRRLAARDPYRDDLARLDRWSSQLVGRGACRHPDGAVGLLRSAFRVFRDEFSLHQHRRCTVESAGRRAA